MVDAKRLREHLKADAMRELASRLDAVLDRASGPWLSRGDAPDALDLAAAVLRELATAKDSAPRVYVHRNEGPYGRTVGLQIEFTERELMEARGDMRQRAELFGMRVRRRFENELHGVLAKIQQEHDAKHAEADPGK
jgi:hypothetical protein